MNAERGTRNAELRKRQATRHPSFRVPSSEFRVRRAFTLFEVTLVLALLVLIAALAWPALEGPFASQRLKAAADQLRADFTRARTAAINSGRTHCFSLGATAGHYVIMPIDDGTASDPFSLPTEPAAATTAPSAGRPLPDGVVIQGFTTADDAAPPPVTGEAAVHGIYFFPDGTATSADVLLRNDRELFIQVRLRGLTGATAVGDVYGG